MTSLFATPDPDLQDQQAIGEIHETRASLASYLRTPKRWNGLLRRTSTARAIQGSNTIEGYTVSDADAVASLEQREVLVHQLGDRLDPTAPAVLTHALHDSAPPRRTPGSKVPDFSRGSTVGQRPTRSQPRRELWLPSSWSSRER